MHSQRIKKSHRICRKRKQTFTEDREMWTDAGEGETCSQEIEECCKIRGEKGCTTWVLGLKADILQKE